MWENCLLPPRTPSLCGNRKRFPGSMNREGRGGQQGVCRGLVFFKVEGEGWQCRWSQEQHLVPRLFGGLWVSRNLGWRSPFGWQWSPSCQHEVLLCLPSSYFCSWIVMSCKCLGGEGQEQEPMSWAMGIG